MAKAISGGGLSDPLEISRYGFRVIVESETGDGSLMWGSDPELHFECIAGRDCFSDLVWVHYIYQLHCE